MKGKCPKRGTLLVKDDYDEIGQWIVNREVRCPSCTSHFHRLSKLEWSE